MKCIHKTSFKRFRLLLYVFAIFNFLGCQNINDNLIKDEIPHQATLIKKDKTQFLLEEMEMRRDESIRLKGMRNYAFYIENCPKQLSFWQQSANQGKAIAQSFLGCCYLLGEGVSMDESKALAWFRKSASQGNANAETNMGYFYANGKGVPKNEAHGVAFIRKAAEKGYFFAQAWIGYLYAKGKWVTKDEVQAVKWFRKAAEQGDAGSQANMGSAYMTGRGVVKDENKGQAWVSKIC